MNKMTPSEISEQPIQNGIREATLDDIFALAKINYDGWTQNYRGIIDDDFLDMIDLQKKQEKMIEGMKNDDGMSICLVYMMDGKLVGFVHGGKKRDENVPYEAEIYAIYVDPATQGHGVGKALMNRFFETIQFRNNKSFYLRTLSDNPKTRGFYEKLGGSVFAEKEHEIGGKRYPMVGYYWEKK